MHELAGIEMADDTTTTLDYIDNIVVPGEVFKDPANEFWALMCLWKGMEYLNAHIVQSEVTAAQSIEAGGNVSVENYGMLIGLPESIRPAIKLLTMSFHWYAISACQFVRLVGAIGKRYDDSRVLPNDYANPIMPEVIAFRDKVAAHFSWSSKNNRDNDAERKASILPPLAFKYGKIVVCSTRVHLKSGGKVTDSSNLKEWSLSEVHDRLRNRYLPPSAREHFSLPSFDAGPIGEVNAIKGVTIEDANEHNLLSVDLQHILAIAGERALHSQWTLFDIEVGGEGAAAELDRICQKQESVDGTTLLRLSKQVWQVIDGRFEAIDKSNSQPWLIIQAVDSSAFDVITNDMDLLERVRASFRKVSDMPDDAL